MNSQLEHEPLTSDLDSQSDVEEKMSSRREDNDWHDVADEDRVSPLRSSIPVGRPSQLPKRRTIRKTPSPLLSRRKTPMPYVPPPPPPARSRQSRLAIDKDAWLDSVADGTVFTFKYSIDVLGRAIRLMRIPFSILLFLWMLAFVVTKVQHTMRTAFAPLCAIPGMSSLRMCALEPTVPPMGPLRKPRRADYPKMVDLQSKTFEQLLDPSIFAGSSSLPMNIKNSEMATRDLATLVKVSNMKSKDSIAETLDVFIRDSKTAGRSLSKLNAKIGGAVDGITAVNDYALHSIEEAYKNSPTVFDALVPWSNKPSTREVVTKTFTEAMEVLSTHMRRLILEAEISHSHLEKLEENLATLHDAVAREDSSITSARAELLSDLWTKLGRNRAQVERHETNLALLKNLGMYRKKALVHVSSALQALRTLSDDIEELREKVSGPELAGIEIPVEVHMKSIKLGLDRLRENRISTREEEATITQKLREIDTGES